MSSQDIESLESDLTFLKKLAASGRGKPAPMAGLLMSFGLIYGLTVLLLWVLSFTFLSGGLSRAGLNAWMRPTWVSANILFLILLLVFTAQAWLRRGESTKMNPVASAAWTAAALSLLTVITSLVIFGGLRNNDYALNILPAITLVLWGAVWFVSASATGQKWIYAVAMGSFAAALISARTGLLSVNGFLVVAMSLLLLAFVPGLVLLRKASA